MFLRKSLTHFLNAGYFYLRHLFPLLKRWYQLIRRKEKCVNLGVQVTQGDLVMDGRSVLELIVTARNLFMIRVNGLRIPVVSDNCLIRISLVVEKEVRSITVYGRGIRQQKTFPVPMNDKRLVAKDIRMKRKAIVERPAMLPQVIKPKHQSLRSKSLIIQKKSPLPTLRKTPFILSKTLTEDLFKRLAHNSKTNEQ
jgi:hypothetical protein